MKTDTVTPMTEERFWQEVYVASIAAGYQRAVATNAANYALRELQKLKEYRNES